MGAEFLGKFLEILGMDLNFFNVDKTVAKTELYIGPKTETEGGRIDIIVRDDCHAITIENKVYAGDQENQLLRYDNYAAGKFGSGYKLVYLTLHGCEASDVSTGGEKIEYQTVSYEKNVTNWLGKCAELSQDKPYVCETIKQYKQLIEQITGQDMEDLDTKEIVNLAIENIDEASAIIRARFEIEEELRERYIFEPLKAFAESRGLMMERDPSVHFKKPEWHTKRISVTYDGVRNPWNAVYIGIDSGYIEPPCTQLDCFSDIQNGYWPYGADWLECRDWTHPDNYARIKRGDVVEEIKTKIQAILDELAEKNISL